MNQLMKWKILGCVGFTLTLGACSHPQKKETESPIPGVNAAMMEAPMTSDQFQSLSTSDRYALFKQARERMDQSSTFSAPKFWPNLEDRLKIAREVSLKHWAWSTNYDEFAKAGILNENSVRVLGIPLQDEKSDHVVSAGIMHSYGYLFSLLQTPYGLKSKRWLESKLDESLGLAPGLLGPFPASGEFLSNLTWVLDRTTQKRSKARTCRAIKNVSPDLCALEKRMAPLPRAQGYAETRVELKRGRKTEKLKIITYVIPLVNRTASGETFLLAYEVAGQKRLWVTAFPIMEDFANKVMAEKKEKTWDSTYAPRFNLSLKMDGAAVRSQKQGFKKL